MKKNVFITGVLSKNGSALAKEFRAQGYYVYGVDKKEDYEGVCDRALRFDLNQFVSDAEYRIRFTGVFDEIIPRLDVLINNDNVVRKGHLGDIKLDDWKETLNVNLTGPMMLSKLFLQRLVKANGSILNIGSIYQSISTPEYVAFSSSMGALQGLTKALSADLKGKVRVNSISAVPAEVVSSKKILAGSIPDAEVRYAEELAKMAVYLVSAESELAHGVNLRLDGGLSSIFR